MSDSTLPPELERMIDTYDGDTDEYAKGVIDTWLFMTGRPPERVMVFCPQCRPGGFSWRLDGPVDLQRWLEGHAKRNGHHPYVKTGWASEPTT